MFCRKIINERYGEGLKEGGDVRDRIDSEAIEAIADGFRCKKYGQKLVKAILIPGLII